MHAPSKGFTLVELMVTLVVAVILMTVAVPSMMSIYEASRADNEISRIQDALRFARNHAVSYGASVMVCPADGNACGTDWSKGLRVYMMNAGAQETLRLVEGIKSDDKISSTSGTLTFTSDGLVAAGATFVYCPRGITNESRSVTLSATGVVKSGAKGLACT